MSSEPAAAAAATAAAADSVAAPSSAASAASAAAAAAAARLSAWADAAVPQLELLAERLGASARPYLSLLSPAYEEVTDKVVGAVIAAVALWLLLASARLLLFGGGKQAGGAGAEAGTGAGAGAGAEAEAAAAAAAEAKAKAEAEARERSVFAPVRALVGSLDRRLERYSAEIALAALVARTAVGVSLLAFGAAVKFGTISAREFLDVTSVGAEEAAEAEAAFVRFASTAAVGLGVIVLLPVVLPMPKDRKAPDAALHPADELLRS
jgi:hypothetical protein